MSLFGPRTLLLTGAAAPRRWPHICRDGTYQCPTSCAPYVDIKRFPSNEIHVDPSIRAYWTLQTARRSDYAVGIARGRYQLRHLPHSPQG